MKNSHSMSSIAGRTIVVHGGDLYQRKAFIETTVLNRFPEKPKITKEILDTHIKTPNVEQIRDFIKTANYSSLNSSSITIYIVFGAENLSSLIQNVLLKTLEEVAENKAFILETSSLDSLLPTIQSRAYSIRLEEEGSSEGINIENLKTKSLSELFKIAEEYGEEEEKAQLLVRSLLHFMREQSDRGIVASHINYTDFLLSNFDSISRTNASTRLILENCLLNFYSLFGKK